MKLKAEAKFWDVRISEPDTRKDGKGNDYAYNKNAYLVVAARTLERVVELVMHEHPTAAIHQVNVRGLDSRIILDDDLLIGDAQAAREYIESVKARMSE